MRLIPLLILACTSSVFSQSSAPTVSVIATSLVITPYALTSISHPAHTTMNCDGNSSVFGNFGNSSISCQGTDTPASQEDITGHLYTYYSVIQDGDRLFLISCTRRWRWEKCPVMIVGSQYVMSRDYSSSAYQFRDGEAAKVRIGCEQSDVGSSAGAG